MDGRVRPVRGVLPAVLAAKVAGWGLLSCRPRTSQKPALSTASRSGVCALAQLQGWLGGSERLDERIHGVVPTDDPPADLADVMGQAQARFAVEVAAAGAHHLMLTGPRGWVKRCWRNVFRACCHRCRIASRWR